MKENVDTEMGAKYAIGCFPLTKSKETKEKKRKKTCHYEGSWEDHGCRAVVASVEFVIGVKSMVVEIDCLSF